MWNKCVAGWTILLFTSLIAAADDASPRHQALQGTVVAANGSPAGGAIVWAARFGYGPLVRTETKANANGEYSLDLVPGKWYVWARRGSQGGEGPARHETVEVRAGRSPAPVAIQMEERGTLRGRLVAAESKEPIAGAQLFLDAAVVLTTDAEGRFSVGGLFRGDHESFVVAPGRLRMRVLFDTTAQADTELEVAVPVGGKITGRVTDLEDKPIPGAYVGRATSGSYFSINGLYVACDEEGRFEYDDAAPPGQPTRLKASAPGYVEEEQNNLVVSAGSDPLQVNFRLRRKPLAEPRPNASDDDKRRIISGIVRKPDGQLAKGVLVRWGYQAYSGAIEARTNEEGRFRIVVPGDPEILAILPETYVPEFLRIDGGSDETVEVRLSASEPVFGRVVDDEGKPIEGVRVVAVVRSPDPRIGNSLWLTESAARTGDDGRFFMAGIPENARFDFLKPELTSVRNHSLERRGTDNVVTLLYGGAVVGRVVDQDGQPIRSFRVIVGFPRVRKPDDKQDGFFAGYSGIGVHFTSPDGRFVLTGVGAGSVYRITALAEGYGEATADRVTAVALNRIGSAEPVTLRAGLPSSLKVRALTGDGKPIPGARVTLVNGEPGLDQTFAWGYHDASWEDMVRGQTTVEGEATFPTLSFGEATVLVQATGYARQRLGWREREDVLSFQLMPEGVIAGEVRDEAGAPVRECYISASSGGDQISEHVGPDAEGRFRIDQLPAGKWAINVRAANSAASLYSGDVNVEAGTTQTLAITAKRAKTVE